jgi:hypothetical protein
MSMQEPFSELMRQGRIEGEELRRQNLLGNSGEEGRNIKEESLQRTVQSTSSSTASRTVAMTGRVTVDFEEEDDEVMIEMEKAPKDRIPAQTLGATRYRSRWMKRKRSSTIASQTSLTWEDPEALSVKMEAMNLEAIAKAQEKQLKADILAGTLRQKRLK